MLIVKIDKKYLKEIKTKISSLLKHSSTSLRFSYAISLPLPLLGERAFSFGSYFIFGGGSFCLNMSM